MTIRVVTQDGTHVSSWPLQKPKAEDIDRRVDHQDVQRRLTAQVSHQDMDAAFLPLYESCRRYTMGSIERMFDLYKSVEYVVEAGVSGAIAECGVWRGGMMMLAARTLLSLGDTSRRMMLFDTFEGHPMPDPAADFDIEGHSAAAQWHDGWAMAEIGEVWLNMSLTKYPTHQMQFVRGRVEDTLPTLPSEPLAVLRLDTDWYSGAVVEMKHLWPMLSLGGVLIIDDYIHYPAQRRAVDEYFAAHGIAAKPHRVDYSCRSFIKT